MFSKSVWHLLVGATLLSTTSCAGNGASPSTKEPAAIPQTKMDESIAALSPAKLVANDMAKQIDAALESHFARNATRRGYLMTDKPLYQPGETIWFRADLRATGTLVGAQPTGLRIQLVSPRGATVADKRVLAQNGIGQNDFALPAEIEGGEYTLQLTADDGTTDAKKIVVNTYEPPRLKKSLEFVRKAYGEGDTVSAAIDVKRATGEAFADKSMTGVISVDDVEIARIQIKTDKDGKATARFPLPAKIARGDGLLTVLVEDGGVTESIQKRIPIVMKTLAFSMFPEGGDLIDGVPGRVYFMAKTTIGKPADIEGKVVDDRGTVVAELSSIHDGMGRFELQPIADRTYHVEIVKPVGITAKFEVPAAKAGGCVVRAMNAGTNGAPDQMRIATICSTSRTVLVEAALREKKLASGAVKVVAGTPTLIELPIDANAQGAVRVTLFSTKQEPLAERLVYHGRGQDLKVTMTAEKKSYSPRDPVKLKIKAVDAGGKPVKANLGIAVVDDTVLAFSDDKSAKLLAHLYLEPELGVNPNDPQSVIEEPNFYFSKKPEAAAAMDALLATRGYRRFEWQQVFAPPQPIVTATMAGADMAPEMDERPRERPMGRPPMAPRPPANVAPAALAKKPMAMPAKQQPAQEVALKDRAADKKEAKLAEEKPRRGPGGVVGGVALDRAQRIDMNGKAAFRDDDWDGEKNIPVAFAPVRVFPVPQYARGYDGPRTDFRETIYWNPNVETNADGTAEVAFVANDAITSFRATAEGVSMGGVPGGGDLVFQSKMPLTLDAKLPIEVTSGDEIRLPITLTNETDGALDADLSAQFGAAFKLGANPAGKIHLNAGERKSVFFPLRVVGTDGSADIEIALNTIGLKDQIKKTIRVVPLGFPFEVSASGTARGGEPAHHEIALDGALPGSIKATVTMYPSPLASMTKGMDAMIREPGGCFEQTSSTNYPNIMILGYLGANDGADAALVQKTQGVLDKGYKLLTGYETKAKGYEWFGQNPGHEALTAYGLMEFADMAKVYDVDGKMVERTADWLSSRRDGKGGFQRSTQALDSFGRAGEATTNAYIMWALAEAGRTKGMDKELAVQKTLGAETKDPYLLALATNTAILTKSSEAASMVKRLIAMQAKDGSFAGAKESITMSGGESLAIEATGLAVLALIKASPANEYEAQIRTAVDFLNAKRSGYGQWSNTQATILGLKALTAYSEHARQMAAPGSATLIVNGKPAGTVNFDKGRKDALVWDDLATFMKPGKNTVELRLDSQAALPYSIAIEYRSAQPQSSDKAKVSVETRLDKTQVKMGEGVKLHAHVENRTRDGIPMTLARVGIPGGMVFQTWQLKELREKGLIDFYETRPREVILYWRAMAPAAKKDVDINLLAAVPGTYEAPASSAYLYYTAEDKAWTAPVKLTVDR